MIFLRHIPLFPLGLFVENFIYYRDFHPAHNVDRFLPDGNVHLVIDLTENPKYIYDNETLKPIQLCRRSWFSGIRSEAITIPSGKESEMMIVNFQKGKAYPFIGHPLYEVTDHVIDGYQALGKGIDDIRDQLQETVSIISKFNLLEHYLLQVFKDKMVLNPCVDYATNQILQNPNQLSIERVMFKTGYSQKHMIKLFKDQVGLTPKSFMNVIRFQKTIEEIGSGKAIKWSELAAECGYYDQAHFIHDFKHFSGFTPAQYQQRTYEFINYIPVG